MTQTTKRGIRFPEPTDIKSDRPEQRKLVDEAKLKSYIHQLLRVLVFSISDLSFDTYNPDNTISRNYIKRKAVNATYSVTEIDELVECTANTFTVTLTTAIGKEGRLYNIKNSGVGLITVDAFGGQLVDGFASIILAANEAVTVYSDDVVWWSL